MTTESSPTTLGERIRKARTDRRLSLRNLAQASDLSINTISLVERNKISPSVSTLRSLAEALNVPIAAFFEAESTPQSVVYTRSGQRGSIALPHGTLEKLGTGLTQQCMEPLLLVLNAGADSGPDPAVHGGHEFVFCVQGEIFYNLDGNRYLLGPCDSLLFEASLPHRWGNAGSDLSMAVVVFSRPEGPENILSCHLAVR